MQGRRETHRGRGKQRADLSLKQLERQFARFRRDHPPQTRIPDALRREALAAMRLGVTRSQLRRACGISSDQLKHWQRNRGGAGSQAEPNIQGTQVFSVIDDISSEEVGTGVRDGGDELELRLGGWSIAVRRVTS